MLQSAYFLPNLILFPLVQSSASDTSSHWVAGNLRASFNSFFSFYSDIQSVIKSCVFYLCPICPVCQPSSLIPTPWARIDLILCLDPWAMVPVFQVCLSLVHSSPYIQMDPIILWLKLFSLHPLPPGWSQATIASDTAPAYSQETFSLLQFLFMHPCPIEASEVPWICHILPHPDGSALYTPVCIPPCWSETPSHSTIFHLTNSHVSSVSIQRFLSLFMTSAVGQFFSLYPHSVL